jgi:arginyl-tRNA synthetase
LQFCQFKKAKNPMSFIEQNLIQNIQAATEALYHKKVEKIILQATNANFEGSHTLVTFGLAKELGQSPESLAQAIGQYLVEKSGIVTQFNVAKGFLNLTINDQVWLQVFNQMRTDKNFGYAPQNGQRVMVEYSSPNTNKPLHLGHLRNIFLGWSMAKILEANGYEVSKTCIVNDRGIHICKSMLAYQKLGEGETPETAGIKGDHLVGKYYVEFDKLHKSQIKPEQTNEKNPATPALQEAEQLLIQWEKGDSATVDLWKKMNGWVYAGFNETYQKVGVSFDKTYYESDTYLLGKDIVQEGLDKGVFYRAEDTSVWIDLTAEKLDKKILLRSNGTSVYMTQDLGTADLKYADYQLDKSIYVVGNEQDYHFKVLFKILDKLGRSYAPGLYHLSYGMVELPEGKMKSREGTVVDADDLLAEMLKIAQEKTDELGKTDDFTPEELQKLYHIIGTGAIKYFLLKVDPKKKMLFNPQESVDFQGDAAPFIQYNFARINSILRKAKQLNVSSQVIDYQAYTQLHSAENHLLQLLASLPAKIKEAAEGYAPSVIAQYAYEVAKGYSKFFAECSIFNAETEAAKSFRVALSAMTAQVIQKAMDLLGIDVPEKM